MATYDCGEENANGTADAEVMNSWKKIEQQVGRLVVSSGLVYGGVKLIEIANRINEGGNAIANSAQDGLDKVFGGLSSGFGLAGMGLGSVMVVTGTALAYQYAKEHDLKNKFVNAYRKAEAPVKAKVAPFLSKAIAAVKDRTTAKGVDIADENGKYTTTYVGKDSKGEGKYVKQPLKVIQSWFAKKRVNGGQ